MDSNDGCAVPTVALPRHSSQKYFGQNKRHPDVSGIGVSYHFRGVCFYSDDVLCSVDLVVRLQARALQARLFTWCARIHVACRLWTCRCCWLFSVMSGCIVVFVVSHADRRGNSRALLSRGDIGNKYHLWFTRKPIDVPVFTNNILSYYGGIQLIGPMVYIKPIYSTIFTITGGHS